jgi:Fe-S oxidoreductase/nitrate reductase gamma subunit
MHCCVFYGMLLLFAGSVLVALEMHFGLKLLRGTTYLTFSLILDLAGVAVLVGAGLAAYKRYVVRPDRLESCFGDAFLLIMLAVVVLSGFLVKGLRLFAASDPWAAWSPVGNGVAALIAKIGNTQSARHFHRVLWYGHAALAFTMIALVPWTKLLHLFAVPLNYYLSLPWAERASLTRPPAGVPPVTGVVADCTRKQLVEADACIECGRCKKRCPIYQGGIPSSPATIMKNLKKLIHKGSFSRPLVGSVIDEPALWSCSACRSCEDRCPMNGAHATTIIDIRRGRVDTGQVPDAVAARFAENETALAVAKNRRTAPDVNGDVYIWPGCREEKPGQTATFRTLAGLLKKAGLTATVLAPPACCGSPIRRLGNESLFRRDAAANIDYLKAIQGKTIITHCPHCFNTLKNEYPRFGGNFRVMHHSQYLAGLLAEGNLRPTKNLPPNVTFHDPCFLGRYNDEYASPRKLINAVKDTALCEMKHSRRKSFCCGSGGGTVAAAVALSNSRKRVRQAVKEGAEAVITCCPYCHENLAAAALEEYPEAPPRILDIIESLDSGGTHETRGG